MQAARLWLIAGIILCIAEMLTGTFFLLVIGVAALAGAAVAWFGADMWLQVCAASAIAVIGVGWVQVHRRHSPGKSMPALDLGQPVSFEKWISQSDGMARINYRGSTWDARLPNGLDPAPGTILFIQAVEGSVFQVSDNKPPATEG